MDDDKVMAEIWCRNEMVKQKINQSSNRSINQSITTIRPISQPINQSSNQLIKALPQRAVYLLINNFKLIDKDYVNRANPADVIINLTISTKKKMSLFVLVFTMLTESTKRKGFKYKKFVLATYNDNPLNQSINRPHNWIVHQQTQ